MSRNIKETLLSTLVHGEETLNNIEVMRRVNNNKIYQGNRASEIISKLHSEELDLIVSEINEVTKDAKSIRFVSANGYLPPFEAGQYINVFTNIQGVRTSRPYSISSSNLQRGYYEITVARIQTGFVSDYFLDEVKVGDCFKANGPSGVFRYNPVFHQKKSVYLAGGSGITPFMSMIRSHTQLGDNHEMHLLYGVRSLDLAIYHQELLQIEKSYPNFHYHLVLSEPTKDYQGATGFLNMELITKLIGNINDCTYYICGPQVMNDFCVKELEKANIPAKRIKREMFGSRQDIINEAGWPKELTGEEVFKVKIGDQIIEAKAKDSLLTSLEKAGIRVNVCCRSGECSLCKVKLISGNIFLSKGMMLRHADKKFGYVHSCKSYPISDIEIIL
ncbi:MAG: iron-sulfur cluster-binding domain-containing protein [Erysipelotrichaceae bacterium]